MVEGGEDIIFVYALSRLSLAFFLLVLPFLPLFIKKVRVNNFHLYVYNNILFYVFNTNLESTDQSC